MPHDGEPLTWSLSPMEALHRWPADQRVLMLHSGRRHDQWSRYTLLTRAEGAYRFRIGQDGVGRSEWVGDSGSPIPRQASWSHRPLRDLSQVLADPHSLWIGYLGYDLGRYIEKLPSRALDDRGWPIVQMQRCPGWLVHDNRDGCWYACGTWRRDTRQMPDLPRLPVGSGSFRAGIPRPLIKRNTYERLIERTIEYIAAGDVFQVNLTQRFTAEFEGSTRLLYKALAQHSPAWYGAYLELDPGPEGLKADEPWRAIASTSPELFFQLDENRQIVTRPIKGTRPATVNPEQLLASAKDEAELTMIVDLLRNDLGRVCDYGSVRVPRPREIETHPTVHHTTATVTGRLHSSKTLIDLLRALMPGGSITGAPKVRAMQIIDELEPVRRGPYTGAIGYVHGGAASFNIAIRTMLIETDRAGRGRVDYGVGGGIVADSLPAAEYHETLDKAAAMRAALGANAALAVGHAE